MQHLPWEHLLWQIATFMCGTLMALCVREAVRWRWRSLLQEARRSNVLSVVFCFFLASVGLVVSILRMAATAGTVGG